MTIRYVSTLPVDDATGAVATSPAAGSQQQVTLPSPNTFNYISSASTNATLVKAGPTILTSYHFTNTAGTACAVKVYDKASAPVVGTDIPVMTVAVPANGNATANFGALGKRFTNGLAFAITGTMLDTGTTPVAASQAKVSLDYI